MHAVSLRNYAKKQFKGENKRTCKPNAFDEYVQTVQYTGKHTYINIHTRTNARARTNADISNKHTQTRTQAYLQEHSLHISHFFRLRCMCICASPRFERNIYAR